MVLHVARALHIVRAGGDALELGEDLGVGLLHHVHQHVQPAAMRHADGDLLHPRRRAELDHRLHRGDGAFAAFEAEALGGNVALRAERLEALGLRQLLQDRPLGRHVEGAHPGRALHPLLDPSLLVRRLDVHELDADRPAIGGAHHLHDLADGRRFQPEHVVDEDRPVPVLFREAVGRRVQLLVVLRLLQAERVELRLQVAAHPVGADQHQRAERIELGLADRLRVGRGNGGNGGALPLGRPRRVRHRREATARPRRPGSAGGVGEHRPRIVVQRREQLVEGRIDAPRPFHPAGVKIREERGIRPRHRGCEDVHSGHA